MRLIDGTIQALPMSNYIIERKETFIEVLQKGDYDFLFAMLMDYFDAQPTAYDIEKVVAELACNSRFIDDINEHNIKCISCVVGQKIAIDIVRKGGVE